MEARCGEEMSRDMGEGRIPGSGFFMLSIESLVTYSYRGGVDNSLIRLVFDRTRFRRVISGGGLFSCFLLGGEIVKNDECRSLAIGYLF